jgi:uncharacterized Fe-S cluster-containing radical SAM superfamily protein
MLSDVLAKTKIKFLQLDPFGYCNAKCWFCPVKYFPQPEEGSGVMPIELVDKILSEIYEEKNKPDGIVHSLFNLVTLSHYNEILLYKHFDELLALLRKYSFKCYVLSNGIPLSNQKVDLIKEYKDVVIHVGLNVPAFEKSLWAKRTGFTEDHFDRLMENLNYAQEQLQHLGDELQIGVNGIDQEPISGGYIATGEQFESHQYDLNSKHGEHETQFNLGKKMFPKTNVHKNYLYDRAGTIDHIVTNKPWIKQLRKTQRVTGCNNGGDRSKEWLNVNSAGHTFLCCNDYHFDYKFGDLKTQSIREVWLGEKRAKTVLQAYSEICKNCHLATFN